MIMRMNYTGHCDNECLSYHNVLIFSSTGAVNGSFVFDLSDFGPGSHSLDIMATSDEGEIDFADTIFFSVLGRMFERNHYYNLPDVFC